MDSSIFSCEDVKEWMKKKGFEAYADVFYGKVKVQKKTKISMECQLIQTALYFIENCWGLKLNIFSLIVNSFSFLLKPPRSSSWWRSVKVHEWGHSQDPRAPRWCPRQGGIVSANSIKPWYLFLVLSIQMSGERWKHFESLKTTEHRARYLKVWLKTMSVSNMI